MDRLPAHIETARLTLRQWTEGDAPALSLAIEESLDHLRPWMQWIAHEPATLEDRVTLIRKWRTGWEEGGDSVVGIFHHGSIVGSSGLHRRGSHDTVEIGYWMHANHLRQGYATEAAKALTEAAFEIPAVARVEIRHDKANTASAGVPRRLGFTLVGEVPDEITAPAEVGIDVRWVKHRDSA